MELDLGNNPNFDFTQEFHPSYHETDFVCNIYKYTVYRMTPANLFSQEIEYFTMLHEASNEIAFLGVKWILQGKVLRVQTRMCISKGDTEVFGFVADELVDIITKKKLEDIKSEKH